MQLSNSNNHQALTGSQGSSGLNWSHGLRNFSLRNLCEEYHTILLNLHSPLYFTDTISFLWHLSLYTFSFPNCGSLKLSPFLPHSFSLAGSFSTFLVPQICCGGTFCCPGAAIFSPTPHIYITKGNTGQASACACEGSNGLWTYVEGLRLNIEQGYYDKTAQSSLKGCTSKAGSGTDVWYFESIKRMKRHFGANGGQTICRGRKRVQDLAGHNFLARLWRWRAERAQLWTSWIKPQLMRKTSRQTVSQRCPENLQTVTHTLLKRSFRTYGHEHPQMCIHKHRFIHTKGKYRVYELQYYTLSQLCIYVELRHIYCAFFYLFCSFTFTTGQRILKWCQCANNN